jgi:hypothetical protein
LLSTFKQENAKLKEELDRLRKDNMFIEKFIKTDKNKTGQKMTTADFSSMVHKQENELNNIKGIMHNSVIKIKEVFDKNSDEFIYAFKENINIQNNNKTLEEKFQYNLDKLMKYIEVKLDKNLINIL